MIILIISAEFDNSATLKPHLSHYIVKKLLKSMQLSKSKPRSMRSRSRQAMFS